MNRPDYPIAIAPLAPEDGGGFVAYAPDLRGCMSDGETIEEAARNIQDAISEWIEEAEESGQPIPAPGSAAQRATDTYKKLYQALAHQDELIDNIESVKGELSELRELFESLKDCVDDDPSPHKLPHVALPAWMLARN